MPLVRPLATICAALMVSLAWIIYLQLQIGLWQMCLKIQLAHVVNI
jgi:hypothetical protein